MNIIPYSPNILIKLFVLKKKQYIIYKRKVVKIYKNKLKYVRTLHKIMHLNFARCTTIGNFENQTTIKIR